MTSTNKENEVTSEFFEKQEQPNMSEYRDFTALSQVGFTSVYKVRRYGKWYILKTLGEEYRGKEPYESLLKKDFEIGITLDHVNIVRYLDYVNVPGYGNAITMEYVDGQTLDIFLSSAPDLEMKIRILNQILDGVEYLHMHQIVHRDLKPQNIIISTNADTVKIIDLGLADKSDYAILKESAGTRGYAAPEVIQNKEQADARADIYSLGKVLTDMHLPSSYCKVITKCTQCKKEERYQSIKELRDAFNTKKRRVTWPAILAAALVLVIGILVFANNISSEQTISSGIYESYTRADSIRLYNRLTTEGHKAIDKILNKYAGEGPTDTITDVEYSAKQEKCAQEMSECILSIVKKVGFPNTAGSKELNLSLCQYMSDALGKLHKSYEVIPSTQEDRE